MLRARSGGPGKSKAEAEADTGTADGPSLSISWSIAERPSSSCGGSCSGSGLGSGVGSTPTSKVMSAASMLGEGERSGVKNDAGESGSTTRRCCC